MKRKVSQDYLNEKMDVFACFIEIQYYTGALFKWTGDTWKLFRVKNANCP